MSEQELYEVAQQRVDRRTRRWTLWSVNLGILILTLAALILLRNPIIVAAFIGWGGVFTVHTILAALAESRDGSIEKEVVKLREAANAYEKRKRDSAPHDAAPSHLELSDDGELVEIAAWEDEAAYAKRG